MILSWQFSPETLPFQYHLYYNIFWCGTKENISQCFSQILPLCFICFVQSYEINDFYVDKFCALCDNICTLVNAERPLRRLM
jgi:hypothetical protein